MSDHDTTEDVPNRRDVIHLAGDAGGTGDDGFPEVHEVTGKEGEQMVEEAKNSESYSRIHHAIFDERGYSGGDSLTARPYVIEQDGDSRYAVSFIGGGRNNGPKISMAIPVYSSVGDVPAPTKPDVAEGVIELFDGGDLDEVETIRDRERGIESQRFEHPLNITEDLPDLQEEDLLGGSAACGGCKTVYGFVCNVGCGLGAAMVCFALGVTGWGGVVCSVIGAAVCYFIGKYGCSKGAKEACRSLDYCPPTPSG